MIKKLIISLVIFVLVFTVAAFAKEPKFKLHILNNLIPGFNYSINYPIVIDYDNDGDQDILIISKEGVIYFLENLTNV